MILTSTIINKIQSKIKYSTINEIKDCVSAILEIMSYVLQKNKKIEIRKFGCFYIKKHAQRIAINPKNNEKFIAKEKLVVRFRASEIIKKCLINNNARGL